MMYDGDMKTSSKVVLIGTATVFALAWKFYLSYAIACLIFGVR